ncbi:uncharacterized protein A4U43_C05F26950 [Asparagus officinalis]|uniref:Uncharacterized protein n=1 Tax=Asparagus officinalis TaxID=4686 RepID=A0A5P1EXA3_ASPOF|nr:uncharacterized protein A4U43_C05F26950 [Asparagus officinalis]
MIRTGIFLGELRPSFGRVEAGGDAGGGVDEDVFGGDAGGGVEGGRDDGGAEESLDAAALEESDDIDDEAMIFLRCDMNKLFRMKSTKRTRVSRARIGPGHPTSSGHVWAQHDPPHCGTG